MEQDAIRQEKERAVELQAAGKWKDALSACQRVLQSAPDDVDTCQRAATMLIRLRRPTEALDLYRRAASLYRQQNQPAKAAAISKLILQIDPFDKEALADMKPAARRPLFVPASDAARTPPARVSIQMLDQLPALAGLSSADREALTPALKIRNVRRGETVWSAGASLEGAVLLLNGMVRLEWPPQTREDELDLIDAPPPAPVSALRRSGALLGSLALFADTPASETITAESDATLLVLPRGRFRELNAHAALRDRLLWAGRDALLTESIDRCELLRTLAGIDRELLVAQSQVRTFPPGVPLVRQGVVTLGLYVLLDGSCRVHHRGAQGDEECPGLGVGDAFGELSLLSSMPAALTVETTTPCIVLGLSRASVLAAAEAHPAVREGLVQKGAEREARAIASARTALGHEVA